MADPKSHKLFHHGLQFYLVVCSCVFTIALMNVYIGVLSEEYNNAQKNWRNSTLKLRTSFMFQLLQKRYALPDWLQTLLGLQHIPKLVEDAETDCGAWIIWDHSLVNSEAHEEDMLRKLHHKVDNLTIMLKRVMENQGLKVEEDDDDE